MINIKTRKKKRKIYMDLNMFHKKEKYIILNMIK